VTKEEIKHRLVKIIYNENPKGYKCPGEIFQMNWELLFNKLEQAIEDAHESYSI